MDFTWQRSEIALWRLATEIVRRDPSNLKLIETHPCGGSYHCLSVMEGAGNCLADFNRGGSCLVLRDVKVLPEILQSFICASDRKKIVDLVCNEMRIKNPNKLPKSTAPILTYRFISEFLSHAVFSRASWECLNGFVDTAGNGGETREHFFEAFPEAKERLRIGMPDDVFEKTAYRFWFLCRDNEPLICLETSGTVWNDKGAKLDFPEAYSREKKIWPSVFKIAGHLLP